MTSWGRILLKNLWQVFLYMWSCDNVVRFTLIIVYIVDNKFTINRFYAFPCTNEWKIEAYISILTSINTVTMTFRISVCWIISRMLFLRVSKWGNRVFYCCLLNVTYYVHFLLREDLNLSPGGMLRSFTAAYHSKLNKLTTKVKWSMRVSFSMDYYNLKFWIIYVIVLYQLNNLLKMP